MKNLTLLFLVLCSINIAARQVITGKVVDKETSVPLQAASVELLVLPDSSQTETSLTNSEGTFMLYKADTLKSYCLRVKYLGYQVSIMPLVKKSGRVNNAGLIQLEVQVIGMKEITIGTSKVRVTELSDRTVYGIPEDMKKTSTDGLDVLRKVPSVQVDYFNEDVAVEGKTNVKIEIDGVTRDKDYLKKLHPSQVDKLEIITAPSGKYDSEVDAVINVITKKEMRYGLKGSVHSNAVPSYSELSPHLGGVHLNLDYGLKKISYNISGGGWIQDFELNNSMNRTTQNILERSGIQKSNYKGGYLNAGFNYDPNEYNNLNLNISLNKYYNKSAGNQFNQQFTDTLQQMFRTITANNGNNGNLSSTLYYKHNFNKNKKHQIEFETNINTTINNSNQNDFHNLNFSIPNNLAMTSFDQINLISNSNPDDTTNMYSEISNTSRQTLSGQANYLLPLDSLYTFGTGINTNFNDYNIDNTVDSITVPGLKYTDWRASSYIELARNAEWGNVKMGSKFETSNVTIASKSQSPYLSFLPYVSGQYKINKDQSIKLNYTRRVIRPNTGQLNPLESYTDSSSVTKGNIDLKPAYRDNIKLTYNLKVGKGKFTGNLSPQVYYEYRNKLIQRIARNSNDGTNRIISMPENISNGYEYGAGLSANMQIFVVMLNSYFGYTYNHINSYKDQVDELNKHGWNWNGNLMSPLPKNFRIFANFHISSPYVNGQEITDRSPFYLFGIMKQFENNSSIQLLAFNPFSNRLFENTTTIKNSFLYQQSNSYMTFRNAIMITYSYNFKIGKDINSKQRNSDQNGEEKPMNLMPF